VARTEQADGERWSLTVRGPLPGLPQISAPREEDIVSVRQLHWGRD
jgi:hypothetical protein